MKPAGLLFKQNHQSDQNPQDTNKCGRNPDWGRKAFGREAWESLGEFKFSSERNLHVLCETGTQFKRRTLLISGV